MKPKIDTRIAIVDQHLEGDGVSIECPEAILYACAAILIHFVEKQRKGIEDVESVEWLFKGDFVVNNVDQAYADLEAARLYRWWKERRIELLAKKEQALTVWSHYRSGGKEKDLFKTLNDPDTPESKAAFDCLNEIEKAYEMECTDFLAGIIKIRNHLWV